MKQAIAGVSPPELGEVTIMTVWPSSSLFRLGRALGGLYAIGAGVGGFTLGRLFMALTVPLALVLYFARLAPGICRRYRLTNRRLVVEQGLSGRELRAVELDDFDGIEIRVLPGQAWYHAGEMIFAKGPVETFRLHAVSRPEAFRHVCLNAQRSYVAVAAVRRHEAATA